MNAYNVETNDVLPKFVTRSNYSGVKTRAPRRSVSIKTCKLPAAACAVDCTTAPRMFHCSTVAAAAAAVGVS